MQKRTLLVYKWWQSLQGAPIVGPVPGGVLGCEMWSPQGMAWMGWKCGGGPTELDNTKEITVI